ncbi:prepilin-type N-terminal cleavage/methylation domain-containing protein [Candidatus Nomurabacteria bacterium]|nr:prepilin-type N-terminal cleavage/methylation domain-containing protein [Candidatus Nomurabacteria bacterium]
MISPSSRQSGLTLIETLVAVFIFSMSLVALMVISARGIQSITVAAQRSTAQFLAQEGIEIIEALRDDNFIDVYASWMDGLNNCFDPGRCQMSAHELYMSSGSPVSCSGDCDRMSLDTVRGYGYYNGAQQTPFIRTIWIEGRPEDETVRVTSHVLWERTGVKYEVTVVKNMMNWFQVGTNP